MNFTVTEISPGVYDIVKWFIMDDSRAWIWLLEEKLVSGTACRPDWHAVQPTNIYPVKKVLVELMSKMGGLSCTYFSWPKRRGHHHVETNTTKKGYEFIREKGLYMSNDILDRLVPP